MAGYGNGVPSAASKFPARKRSSINVTSEVDVKSETASPGQSRGPGYSTKVEGPLSKFGKPSDQAKDTKMSGATIGDLPDELEDDDDDDSVDLDAWGLASSDGGSVGDPADIEPEAEDEDETILADKEEPIAPPTPQSLPPKAAPLPAAAPAPAPPVKSPPIVVDDQNDDDDDDGMGAWGEDDEAEMDAWGAGDDDEEVPEEPTSEEPIPAEPVVEEHIPAEPIPVEPVADEPVIEEPAVEEPVVEEPIVEEPIVEEPVVEEPVVEEPVAEEPIPEEPLLEEPAVEKHVAAEPIAQAALQPEQEPEEEAGMDAWGADEDNDASEDLLSGLAKPEETGLDFFIAPKDIKSASHDLLGDFTADNEPDVDTWGADENTEITEEPLIPETKPEEPISASKDLEDDIKPTEETGMDSWGELDESSKALDDNVEPEQEPETDAWGDIDDIEGSTQPLEPEVKAHEEPPSSKSFENDAKPNEEAGFDSWGAADDVEQPEDVETASKPFENHVQPDEEAGMDTWGDMDDIEGTKDVDTTIQPIEDKIQPDEEAGMDSWGASEDIEAPSKSVDTETKPDEEAGDDAWGAMDEPEEVSEPIPAETKPDEETGEDSWGAMDDTPEASKPLDAETKPDEEIGDALAAVEDIEQPSKPLQPETQPDEEAGFDSWGATDDVEVAGQSFEDEVKPKEEDAFDSWGATDDVEVASKSVDNVQPDEEAGFDSWGATEDVDVAGQSFEDNVKPKEEDAFASWDATEDIEVADKSVKENIKPQEEDALDSYSWGATEDAEAATQSFDNVKPKEEDAFDSWGATEVVEDGVKSHEEPEGDAWGTFDNVDGTNDMPETQEQPNEEAGMDSWGAVEDADDAFAPQKDESRPNEEPEKAFGLVDVGDKGTVEPFQEETKPDEESGVDAWDAGDNLETDPKADDDMEAWGAVEDTTNTDDFLGAPAKSTEQADTDDAWGATEDVEGNEDLLGESKTDKSGEVNGWTEPAEQDASRDLLDTSIETPAVETSSVPAETKLPEVVPTIPAVAPVEEPVPEPVHELLEEPTSVHVEEPVEESIEEPAPAAVEEVIPEPVEMPAPAQIEEPVSEPIEEPVSEPIEEPVPAPVEQPAPKPVTSAQAEHVPEASRDLLIEEPAPEQVEPKQTDAEWPADAEDDAFGEIVETQQKSVAQEVEKEQPQSSSNNEGWAEADVDESFLEQSTTTQPELGGDSTHEALAAEMDDDLLPDNEPKEEDLNAAWGAALGDDDLLADDDDELLPDEDELLEDEEDDAPDPSRFFADDGDSSFLEDEVVPDYVKPASQQPQQRYHPDAAPQANPYAPQRSQAATPIHGRGAGTPDTGLFDLYNASANVQPQVQRPGSQGKPPTLKHAQSFADQAKGGYQSPYDLPMEVVKPRRRPQQPQQASSQGQVPPPRSSSFSSSSHPVPQETPPPVPRAPSSITDQSPPATRGVPGGPAVPPVKPAPKPSPSTDSGFFADLPMTKKPRARPSAAYTPQAVATPPAGPVSAAPPQSQSRGATPAQPPQQGGSQQDPAYGLGLRQPDSMPLLPDQPAHEVAAPPQATRAPPSNRYSPAPPATSSGPASNRYSPAPNAVPGQAKTRVPSGPGANAGPPHAFAPRTSSPLAYSTDKPQPALPHEGLSSPQSMNGMLHQSASSSPDRRGSTIRYEPQGRQMSPSVQSPPQMPPQGPMRSRTQSPGAAMKQSKYGMSGMQQQRPTSATGGPVEATKRPVLPHRRHLSRELTFTTPQDERAQDPLERWKGHPVFKWTSSGTILSSLPKQTPYYAAGHGIPTIKCTPGDVSLQDATTFLPMDERNAKFPGPLQARSKGKKKELAPWIAGKVEDLEAKLQATAMDFSIAPDLKKRAEEKLVLWKIVKIFVDNDGSLEGNPKIDEEVRKILLPDIEQMGQVMDLQSPTVQSDPIDRTVIIQLRQALLEGQRERAVFIAEEKKLWGHAMLIASTMGPDMWKQIVQSFVRSQVKSVGSDARGLATLYQIFAGNSDDCVDELVPPSARAGFQMVSKDRGTSSGNPLEGLDQWRETLSMVVSNRTNGDGASLVSLGKLLAGYGRVEAAHTCYMFARSFVKHSGADDTEAHFALLGANHQSKDETFGNDLDSILLTEVYEWASSLSAPSSAVAYIPHLQSYKLMHAQQLAAQGLKSKARNYCEHITTAYSSTTKPSGYYHPTFTQSVAELGAFLSQTPMDGKSGFFSKPAMNKVSSGAASWFTKFVAGDDDRDGTASGPGSEGTGAMGGGPFGGVGGVAGDSAPVSRSPSTADLYNPMMGGGAPYGGTPAPSAPSYAPSTAPSRYAPSSYTPQPQAQAQAPAQPQHQNLQSSGGRYTPQGPGSALQPSPSFSGPVQPEHVPAGTPEFAQSSGQQDPRSLAPAFQAPRSASSSSRYAPSPAAQPASAPRSEASPYGSPYAPTSRRQSVQDTPSFGGNYEPASAAEPTQSYGYQPSQPPAQPEEPEEPEVEDAFAAPTNGFSDESTKFGNNEPDPKDGGYAPPAASFSPPPPSGDEPKYGGYEAPSGGDDVPSGDYDSPSGGYEPPSTGYVPYEPEPEAPEEEDDAPKPKKKGIMDDDDDDMEELAKRAASLKKSNADKEADDAFRKAAEADAARDGGKGGNEKGKPGWFGGWFGKKDPNSLTPAGPVRAKLGEQNSFYYDEQLKKWVNKKGGSEAATPTTATPPPPRGPPSRVASAMGPPSGPPSRVASASGMPPTPGSRPPTSAGPPSRTGTPASQDAPGTPMSDVPSGPPSRPATGMSNANSLDDILGGPPGRKSGGTTKKKKKGGRYVDVMAGK